MAVVDSLVVRKGSEFLPIDSYDNQMIDEIVYEGQSFHFAKQKDFTGTSEIVADNGVDEPIISLGVSGATSQVLLPIEYQQVEYIESTGTQYIDTGVIPTSNTTLEATIQFTKDYTNTTEKALSGITGDGAERLTFGYVSTVSTTNFYIGIANVNHTSNVAFDTKKHKFILQGNGTWSIDNQQGTINVDNLQTSRSIFVFARNNKTVIDAFSKMRLFSYKIYDENLLLLNLIPCYRKSDNVIGMYDLVNNVFYTNSGTGTFLKGANASPTPEAPIPIQNANDNGMSVILRGENLFNAQGEVAFGAGFSRFEFGNNYVTNRSVAQAAADFIVFSKTYPAGTYTISAKGEYGADNFAFHFLCTASFSGGTYNSYYKSYYSTFVRDESPYETITFTTTKDFSIGFAYSGYPTDFKKGTIYDIMLTPTSQAVEYKPYIEETVEIPTSVNNIPLIFTEYDKLLVDRLNNKVVYETYAFPYTYTGEESYSVSGWASDLGYGNYYQTIPKNNVAFTDVLASTHFKKGKWTQSTIMKTQTNIVTYTGTWYIVFKTDGTQSLDDFKAWIKSQYDAGTPVCVIAKRKYAIEHDITNTDLGQALLALATRKGTNYFEISSNLAPSQTDLSYWRQIIPNE